MAYNKYIPNSKEPPSRSCSKILENFTQIGNVFSQNHADFSTADQGKHTFIQMPVQDSAPETAPGEIGLYSKTSDFTSTPELFVRKEDNGDEVDFTSCLAEDTGWTRLPSGILLKWSEIYVTASITNGFVTTKPSYIANEKIPVFKTVFYPQATIINPTNGTSMVSGVFFKSYTTVDCELVLVPYPNAKGSQRITIKYLIMGT